MLLKKINEDKIPDITNLAPTVTLTAVENKILNVSNLLKKSDYNIKLIKLQRNLLIMIMINILLLQNLITKQCKFILHD